MKNWRTPEGAGLTRAWLPGAMEVHAADGVPSQSGTGLRLVSGEATLPAA